MRKLHRRHILALITAATFALAGAPLGAATVIGYDNALQNGWQDWSWAAHNLA